MELRQFSRRDALERLGRWRNERSRMLTIDRAIESFLHEELRNRSLELKLRQHARLVLVPLLRGKLRIPNDVREQFERLIEVVLQAAGIDVCTQRRESCVCANGRSEAFSLLGDFAAGALRRAFSQHRG